MRPCQTKDLYKDNNIKTIIKHVLFGSLTFGFLYYIFTGVCRYLPYFQRPYIKGIHSIARLFQTRDLLIGGNLLILA